IGAERLDLPDNLLEIGMAEGNVFLNDVPFWNSFGYQERLQDHVGCSRKNVVRAEQVELLFAAALWTHQKPGGGHQLLVREGAGIENIRALLFTLVLDWVKE